MARIAEHYVEISARVDKLDKALNKSKSSFKGFGSAISKFAGVVGVAFGAQQVFEFGNEVRKLAAEAEGVANAFKRIGGGAYLPALQNATAGTVNNLELMKAAVQAKNFDIPLSNLASLFEFAAKRAQDTGQSVQQLTNDIVLGIGRKSPLILDNLGISAVALRKELDGVGTGAASVADIAGAVGRIAQKEMSKAGKITETTAVKTARWGATWDNIKVKIGDVINKGLDMIAPFIDSAIAASSKLGERFNMVANEVITLYNESALFRGIIEGIGVLGKIVWGAMALQIKNVADILRNLGAGVIALFKGDFTNAVRNFKEIFTDVGDNFVDFGRDAVLAFNQGIENTMNPRDKVALFGIDDETASQAIAGAEALGSGIAQAVMTGIESVAPGSTMSGGLIPLGIGLTDESSDLMEARLDILADKFEQGLSAVGGFITNFFEGFASAFTQGGNVLANFLDYFKKWAFGIIAQIAAIAAAAAALSIITGGSFTGLFKGLFAQSSLGNVFKGAKTIGEVAGASTTIGGEGINLVIDRANKNRANTF